MTVPTAGPPAGLPPRAYPGGGPPGRLAEHRGTAHPDRGEGRADRGAGRGGTGPDHRNIPGFAPMGAAVGRRAGGAPPAPATTGGALRRAPNEKGLDRLLPLPDTGAPVAEVQLVISVSEAHNRANVNMTVAESLTVLERTVTRAKAAGLAVCGGMATVFGCSLSGRVPGPPIAELVMAPSARIPARRARNSSRCVTPTVRR